MRALFFMGFTVYILYSKSISRYYAGSTQDLANRLYEHNSGETSSIRNGIPWEVIWEIQLPDRSAAMLLESKIKKRGAKRFLEDLSRGA
ncbi:MAG: GIY-YIG nuclease family protein [Cytophagales bacterium]